MPHTAHRYRRRTTVVRMWRPVGRWWWHHHGIWHCVLQLRTLVIIWMSVCWNRGRGHRWPWTCAVGRRICTRGWRSHISLRWWHLPHAWCVHRLSIWRTHTRWIWHRLHKRPRHVSTRRPRGCHSRHHRLSRVTIRWVSINVTSGCSLGSRVLFI